MLVFNDDGELKLLDCTRLGSRPSNLKLKAVTKDLPDRAA